MKVLMFGWEFPPHISGGLGTACYGLTKGLSELEDVEVTFIVPKAFGDENQSDIKLLGANTIPIARKDFRFHKNGKGMECLEVDSPIIPYITEDEFWERKKGKYGLGTRFVEVDGKLQVKFSGKYGAGLIEEIKNYALIAEIIARKTEFDIIHAHDWLAYPAGIAVQKISNKPLVVHVHATEFDRSGGNVNPVVYAIEREGMELADKVITVSNLTRDIVTGKYNIPAEKVETVYNAVEPLFDEPANLPEKSINEKIVTFLGRITLQKGPEYFIEAANLVLQKIQNVRFVMAGSGDMLDAMIARTAELGIADKFHFTGFLAGKDVPRLFNMTDVFVMPSISEPFGIVPLEAMQLKVPVIISNQSGVAEVLENVIKIDFWDTFAMADAIYGIISYSSLSLHFSEEGKSEVDHLKWINSAQKVKDIYESVLS